MPIRSKKSPKQLQRQAAQLADRGMSWMTRYHVANAHGDFVLARAYRRIAAGFGAASALLSITAEKSRKKKGLDAHSR